MWKQCLGPFQFQSELNDAATSDVYVVGWVFGTTRLINSFTS